MQRVRRDIYSGVVLERIVYTVGDRTQKPYRPRKPRFKTDEERARFNAEVARRAHTRIINENFTPASLYSTLTQDDEHEEHDFKDFRRLCVNFRRRLLYAYPEAKIVIYMGRGKNTHRIHAHMLTDGVPEEAIRKQWTLGSVNRCEHLRAHVHYDGIDHGPDYTGLANYLFSHWTPEQGGHHYMATRNLAPCGREQTKPIKRNYTPAKPPRSPKDYILVESGATEFGFTYFKHVKTPERKRRC